MQDYNPSDIEEKWLKVWLDKKLFSPDLGKAKKPFYNLMMFPYPSAEGLHVGNMYAFTGSDIYGRYKRMAGFDVFEPIGLDGFGIHSENYAIKVGKHPREQVKISEKNFYRQLVATGNAYDWQRKLETYDPAYYKWTQWIFIKLFKAGLAYRKKSPVNFCPKDKTVLADEQVIDGKCESCSSIVEKRELEQWFFRITKYADRLLANIDKLDWSERVKIAQKQWIGKSEGASIKFKILNLKFEIEVFTTRPDTLFGATFLVLSPEHPLVSQLKFTDSNRVATYVSKAAAKSEQQRIAEGKEKTGVDSGYKAINPVNGQEIPIFIADYILMGYGTGAIMAVPAHDGRDFEFVNDVIKKDLLNYIKEVIRPESDELDVPSITKLPGARRLYEGGGIIVNSGEWNGLQMPAEIDKVIDWLEAKGIGKRSVNYHLRDWLISRQRYWGPPIPIIYCENCARGPVSSFPPTSARSSQKSIVEQKENVELRAVGSPSRTATPRTTIIDGKEYAIITVPEKDLPILLPEVSEWRPTGSGKSPLATVESFVNTKCPNCGGEARRETDVSDTFLDSAWYYLGYLILGDQKSKIPPEARLAKDGKNQKFRNWELEFRNSLAKRGRWLPVDMYIGGAEHSVLHLLYTRFLTMAFCDLGLVSFEEPFAKFRAHGLLIAAGAKMSKSRGNVVTPDEYIAKYGADTLRCYLMFCGRFQQGGDFSDAGIVGMHRFLKRVWRLANTVGRLSGDQGIRLSGRKKPDDPTTRQPENLTMMHKTIKRVTDDIESLDYNTAVAALMEWLNALEERSVQRSAFSVQGKEKRLIVREEIETFLKLLAPFAPYMTEELWQNLNRGPVTTFHPTSARSNRKSVDDQKDNVELRAVGGPSSRATPKFESIHTQSWPKFDPKLVESGKITLVVQVNGKLRERIEAEKGLGQKEAEGLAKASEKVANYILGKKYKVVYVPDRLINFVTEG